MKSIYIGYDSRESEAFAVARFSILRRLTQQIPVYGLVLSRLRLEGLYRREHEIRNGKTYDIISDAPMATEFSISRFLTPHLAGWGWSLFLDADMLALENLTRLFELADPKKAVMVVKHNHCPKENVKMDNQVQSNYFRKNWSSFMLFNCDHPSNKKLTVDMVNTLPGRDLHQFCWLKDDEIGELGQEWNWLVGYSDPIIKPKVVHYTSGGPWFADYQDVPFAEQWIRERDEWARAA